MRTVWEWHPQTVLETRFLWPASASSSLLLQKSTGAGFSEPAPQVHFAQKLLLLRSQGSIAR